MGIPVGDGQRSKTMTNDSAKQAPKSDQCEICAAEPPLFTDCAGLRAPESAACGYIDSLETELAAKSEALGAARIDQAMYDKVLGLLGMHEEGDPLVEIISLQAKSEALEKAEAKTEILRAQLHGMQDGALVRDQAARISDLERQLASAEQQAANHEQSYFAAALQYAELQLAEIRDALAGTDISSLPSNFTTVRMAHQIRADHDKFLWQVRDTCARSESAEQKIREKDSAIIAMAEDGWLYHGPEGMSEAQKKLFAEYGKIMIKDIPNGQG